MGFTLWLFNIAMENGPFIDGLPIKNGDFPFSMAMLNDQRVYGKTHLLSHLNHGNQELRARNPG